MCPDIISWCMRSDHSLDDPLGTELGTIKRDCLRLSYSSRAKGVASCFGAITTEREGGDRALLDV